MRRVRLLVPANLASQATVVVHRRPSTRAAAGEGTALPAATARVRDTLILRAVLRAQSDADCAR